MSVQCSSEFFITLLIDADEDCLVQLKHMATKYIIFFWYCQQQLFSHNWHANRITNLISFDIYIYIEENKFGVILLPIIFIHSCIQMKILQTNHIYIYIYTYVHIFEYIYIYIYIYIHTYIVFVVG